MLCKEILNIYTNKSRTYIHKEVLFKNIQMCCRTKLGMSKEGQLWRIKIHKQQKDRKHLTNMGKIGQGTCGRDKVFQGSWWNRPGDVF